MVTNLIVGGADRFEAQAEANEARILAAAVSGRWEGLFQRTTARVDRTLGSTVAARLQRRPIGGQIGGAMIQAAFGGLFGDDGRGGGGGGGPIEASAGAGQGTVVIEGITLVWQDAPASAPGAVRPKAQPSLEHVSAPDRRPGAAPAGFSQGVERSAGQPLPSNVRAKMEQAFGGVDLTGVRVHTGPEAQALTTSIHARAFATGDDVFFNQGQFDPHSPRGLALLGHELTHVLQQRSGASPLPGAPSAHGVRAARTLLSPLGRGGLFEAAGSSQAQRLAGPDAQIRRKASAMVRRSAGSLPASSAGSSKPTSGAAPAVTAQGQVVIESLTVTVTGAAAPGAAPSMVTVQGKGAHLGVRPKAGHTDAGAAPGGFAALLGRSAGTPLPQRLNEQLGALLGADFSDVRVHTGDAAAKAAASIHAEAFAVGRDIYFGAGRWDPTSPRGIALIGHELTHVAQERGGAKSISRAEIRRADVARGGAPAAVSHPKATSVDRDLAEEEFDYLIELFKAAYKEKWFLRSNQSQFTGNLREAVNLPLWLYDKAAGALSSDPSWKSNSYNYAGCRNFAADTFELFAMFADPRYHKVEHIVGTRWYDLTGDGKSEDYGYGIPNPAARHQVVRVTNAVTGQRWIFDMWALQGGWIAGGGDDPDPDWSSAIYPTKDFGFKHNITVEQSTPVHDQFWRNYRPGGMWHRKPYPEIKRPERLFKKESGGGLVVAGHDAYEQQALQNERAILQAMQGGGPGPVTRPGYMALRASTQGAARGARLSRRAGLISPRSRWERFKGWVSETLESNREYWDEVGVRGIQRGGVVGYTQAGFAALFSGINQPELAQAYVEGLGSGVVNGVKGVVNMVVHPIETAQGMYRLVVHFDETKAGLKAKVAEYVEAASSDPEKFARMTGELVGQIEVALVGPKVIGGPREVLGAIRTARNVLPKGRTLWYYTDDVGAAGIAPQGVGRAGQVGRVGATEVFATPLDPLLGGSRSLMGMFARNVFLGGRLDFVRKAGQLLPRMRIKAAFTQAVGFKGGAFRHIFFTEVETAIARMAKSVFPQYAASGPQQVQIVAQAILSRRETLHALLDGAGMLGTGSNILIDNTEVPFRDLIESTLEFYGLDAALKKERADLSPADEYLGGSPRERLRRGSRLGRALELLEEPGLPLEQSVRSRLEQALGADLGNVRVHTGDAAERLAREIGAEAFTIGNTIFMGEGAWKPDTVEGLGTLVHEATHVVQADQGRLAGPATPMRTQALEAEAYARERAFVRGASAPPAPGRAIAGAAPAAPARPAPPPLVVREAPQVLDLPAPESAPVPTLALKKPKGQDMDPIQRVMDAWNVSEMSREEFLEACTERVLELMREEVEVDAERGATNLAWSYDAPLS